MEKPLFGLMLLARPCLAKRSMEGNYMGFVPITNQITNINVSTIIVIICEKLNSLAQSEAQSRAQYSSFTLSGRFTYLKKSRIGGQVGIGIPFAPASFLLCHLVCHCHNQQSVITGSGHCCYAASCRSSCRSLKQLSNSELVYV